MSSPIELAQSVIKIVSASGITGIEARTIGAVRLNMGSPPKELVGHGFLFRGSPVADYVMVVSNNWYTAHRIDSSGQIEYRLQTYGPHLRAALVSIINAITYDRMKVEAAPAQEQLFQLGAELPELSLTTTQATMTLRSEQLEQFRQLDPPPAKRAPKPEFKKPSPALPRVSPSAPAKTAPEAGGRAPAPAYVNAPEGKPDWRPIRPLPANERKTVPASNGLGSRMKRP
jgi:hypothetical protein